MLNLIKEVKEVIHLMDKVNETSKAIVENVKSNGVILDSFAKTLPKSTS